MTRLGSRTARLVREAAVRGFVQGMRNGGEIPPDSVIVANVLRSARSNPDLYPTLSAVESVDEAADLAEATMRAETLAFLSRFTERRGR
jgi:hypothetical protein